MKDYKKRGDRMNKKSKLAPYVQRFWDFLLGKKVRVNVYDQKGYDIRVR